MGGLIIVGSTVVIAILLFAKDPYIKHLSKGMSNNQKEHFQREIEDLKHGEGRGGNDNLTRDLLKEIAEWIKKTFK